MHAIMERWMTFLVRLRTSRKAQVIVFVFACLIIFFPHVVFAQEDQVTVFFAKIIGKLLEWYIALFGGLMTFVMNLVVRVAMYNGFDDASAVKIGWVLMRDLANMALVVILLSMAFGTLLNQGGKLGDYKSLPKFAIIAIVINFSKTITLLMVDASQVIMLSFVAAFQNTAAGNLIRAFQIEKWVKLRAGEIANASVAGGIVLGLLLGAVLVTVVLVVMTTLLAYLVYRVVFLWILIIFSPIAFAVNLLPTRGKEFYAEWWRELVGVLLTGPLLAMFLWITLLVGGQQNGIGTEVLQKSAQLDNFQNAQEQKVFNSEVVPRGEGLGSLDKAGLLSLIITIIMLLLGLSISIRMGGKVGASVGKIGGFAKRQYARAGRWGLNAVKNAGIGAGKAVGKGTLNLAGDVVSKMPIVGGAVAHVRNAKNIAGYAKKSMGFRSESDRKRTKLREDIAVMERFGDKDKVAELKTELIAEEEKKISNLSKDDLILKSREKTDDYENEAVQMALNKKGYFRTATAQDLKDAARGDKVLLETLVSDNQQSNPQAVMALQTDDQIKHGIDTKWSAMEAKDQRKAASGLLNKFELRVGLDGKARMRDASAVHEAANISTATWNDEKTTQQWRDQVVQALLLGIKNSSGKERETLVNKLNELNGSVASDPLKRLAAGPISFDSEGELDIPAGADDLEKMRLKKLQETQDFLVTQQEVVIAKDQVKSARHKNITESEEDAFVRKFSTSSKDGRNTTLAKLHSSAGSAKSEELEKGGVDAHKRAADRLISLRDGMLTEYQKVDASGEKTGVIKEGKQQTAKALFEDSELSKTLSSLARALQKRHEESSKPEARQDKKFLAKLDAEIEIKEKLLDAKLAQISQEDEGGKSRIVRAGRAVKKYGPAVGAGLAAIPVVTAAPVAALAVGGTVAGLAAIKATAKHLQDDATVNKVRNFFDRMTAKVRDNSSGEYIRDRKKTHREVAGKRAARLDESMRPLGTMKKEIVEKDGVKKEVYKIEGGVAINKKDMGKLFRNLSREMRSELIALRNAVPTEEVRAKVEVVLKDLDDHKKKRDARKPDEVAENQKEIMEIYNATKDIRKRIK